MPQSLLARAPSRRRPLVAVALAASAVALAACDAGAGGAPSRSAPPPTTSSPSSSSATTTTTAPAPPSTTSPTTPPPSPGGVPVAYAPDAASDADERYLLDLVNGARADAGVGPLGTDPCMQSVADSWAAAHKATPQPQLNAFEKPEGHRVVVSRTRGMTGRAAADDTHRVVLADEEGGDLLLDPAATVAGISLAVDGGNTTVVQYLAPAAALPCQAELVVSSEPPRPQPGGGAPSAPAPPATPLPPPAPVARTYVDEFGRVLELTASEAALIDAINAYRAELGYQAVLPDLCLTEYDRWWWSTGDRGHGDEWNRTLWPYGGGRGGATVSAWMPEIISGFGGYDQVDTPEEEGRAHVENWKTSGTRDPGTGPGQTGSAHHGAMTDDKARYIGVAVDSSYGGSSSSAIATLSRGRATTPNCSDFPDVIGPYSDGAAIIAGNAPDAPPRD